jgi:23S rRNA (pseudouridine1915-N3)-methyltransferase
MKIKILWPGKTLNKDIRSLQTFYLERINKLEKIELIETREARGIAEKYPEKIKEIEAAGLEKHLKDDYIICLFDKGREMSSKQFADFLQKTALDYPYSLTFIVGGFSGLAERITQRANRLLSLSHMAFSHELTRIILLEQIYRALTILKGGHYAK